MLVIDIFSFIVGLVTVLTSLLVIQAYGWRLYSATTAQHWLACGICSGFAVLAINAGYWLLLVRGASLFGIEDVYHTLLTAGNRLDFLFKGLGIWCAYCHLRAVWLGLPDDHRKEWTIWATAFYPDKQHYIARMLNVRFSKK